MKRRILGFILSASLLLGAMPGMSYAQEATVPRHRRQNTLAQYGTTNTNPDAQDTAAGWSCEDVGDGSLRITGYEGEEEDLVIPAKIEEKNVTEIGSGALAGKPGLQKITVSEGITAIGEEAFADCPNLVSVELPDTVTVIGRRAFRYCTALESCRLPNTLQEFPYQCFWDCRSLSEITIPDGVATIPNGTFYNNGKLLSVTVPDSVTAIEKNAFHACLSLYELHLSENVATIDPDAFSDCDMLVILAPEGSYADRFAKEKGYVPVQVFLESPHPYPHENQQWSYTHPEDAAALKVTFSPTTVFDSYWDRLTITDGAGVNYVYSGARLAGKTLVLAGNSFTMKLRVLEDKKNYFGFQITGIEPMTAEDYQAYLDDLNAHPWLTHVVNGTLEITGYRGKMPDVVIPAQIDGVAVASIKSEAFANNNVLRKVTIEDGLRSIGFNAFRRCENLEEVILPDSVTEIDEYAFGTCTKLEKITLPKENVILGEGVFEGCESLEALVLPEGLTVVEDYLCNGCKRLRSVTLPDSLREIGILAFYNCTALEELALPEGLEAIRYEAFYKAGLTSLMLPSTLQTIANSAFAECENLTALTVDSNSPYFSARDNIVYSKSGETLVCSAGGLTGVITVPDGVKKIGVEAFYYDAKITKVILPDSLTELSDSAFMGCQNLQEIVLPETITVLPEYLFYACDSLKEMRLPESLTEIQERALGRCDHLERVYIPDSVVNISQYAFSDSEKVVIYASADSYPFLFAQELGLKALAAPLAREDLYADGTPKELIIAGKATGGRLVYALGTGADAPPEDAAYSEAIPTGTNAGIYEVWYILRGDEDSDDPEAQRIEVNIAAPAFGTPDFTLPAALTEIGEEAFAGAAIKIAYVPDNCTSIGANAFRGCTGLTQIRLPGNCAISDTAFTGCTDLLAIFAPAGGTTEAWCKQANIPFVGE